MWRFRGDFSRLRRSGFSESAFMTEKDTEYIGDAVYAHYDPERDALELTLNDHRNKTLITLEREVFEALLAFWRRKTGGEHWR